MKSIVYIQSVLDMEKPLSRSRLLVVRGLKAKRGELINPMLGISRDLNLDFIKKAISLIHVSPEFKRNDHVGNIKKPRYSAKIIKGGEG